MSFSSTRRLVVGTSLTGLLLIGSVAYTYANTPFSLQANPESLALSSKNVVKIAREQLKWSGVEKEEALMVALTYATVLQADQEEATQVAQADGETVADQSQAQDQIQVQAEAKQAAPAPAEPKQAAVAQAAPQQAAEVPAEPKQVAEASQSLSRGSSDTIVENALSLQGIPYVFGGMSLKGFDCSGLTKYVMASVGITIPRSSYQQFSGGTKVSREELQPSDLVFFTTYSKGASHVGIYIGGGQFVHASNSGVRITSLSDAYYAPRYLGARRY